jgi:outer membrane protein OmpA-like peptidoglycan-associated protein
VKHLGSCFAAVLASGWLASCAMPRGQQEPVALPPKPLAVGQADDGRFVGCVDCELPTPKTSGRPLATAQRKAGTVTAPLPARPANPIATPSTTPESGRGALRIVRTTITFDAGSTSLNAGAHSRLQQLAPLIGQAHSARAVGFTDDRGSQDANDRVATSRALAVMVHMRRLLGTTPGGPALSADGRGKCCYLNGNRAEGERALNRRVEVQLRFDDTAAVDQLVSRFASALEPAVAGTTQRRTATDVSETHARASRQVSSQPSQDDVARGADHD